MTGEASPSLQRCCAVPILSRLRTLLLVCCAVLFAAIPTAQAQFTAENFAAHVEPVHATQATAMAVHDGTGTLIVARRLGSEQLSVYSLNDSGEVAGDPARLTLPKPEGVDRTAWVQDIAVHPTLPVAYVWQDLEKVNINQAITGPRAEFDHLVIYAIEGSGELEQVAAFARGEAFTLGQTYAGIGISDDGLRLFLPNVGSAIRNKGQVGYYDLDGSTGLPAEQPVPVPGSLDGYGLNKYEMAVRYETIDVDQVDTYLPAGLGWYAPTRDVANFGGLSGFATWDTLNRRAALAANLILTMPANTYLTGHPQASMLYGVGIDSDKAACQPHALGYPTQRPRPRAYPGRRFHSKPFIIPSPHRALVVGGRSQLHLITIDEQWALTDDIIDHPVDAERVSAIAWSERFHKLYVPADNPPQPETEAEADEEGD